MNRENGLIGGQHILMFGIGCRGQGRFAGLAGDEPGGQGRNKVRLINTSFDSAASPSRRLQSWCSDPEPRRKPWTMGG